jgi:hypothetical protein
MPAWIAVNFPKIRHRQFHRLVERPSPFRGNLPAQFAVLVLDLLNFWRHRLQCGACCCGGARRGVWICRA